MTTYYLIQNADNLSWYTEDHGQAQADRWSPKIQEAFRFASYSDAITELNNDQFGATDFFIRELVII